MGIFSKKTKVVQPDQVEADFNDYKPVSANLLDSLTREISIGSTDVKRTSFSHPSSGASYDVYSVGDEIKGVFDNSKKFSLADRLKFVEENGDEGWRLNELEVLSDDDDLSRYRELADADLIDIEVLRGIYFAVAVANAIELDEFLTTTENVDTYTEIISSEKLVKIIRSWDYVSTPVQEFCNFCNGEIELTETLMGGIVEQSGALPEDIVLASVSPIIAKVDSDKAIQWFAERGLSLAEVSSGVDGFLSSQIMVALEKAISNDEVSVSDMNAPPVTDALPDFDYNENGNDDTISVDDVDDVDESVVVADETDEDSAFSGDSVDVDDSLGGFDFSDDDESDDDNCDDDDDDDFKWDEEEESFEKGDSDLPHFIPTTYLFDSIEPSVNEILDSHLTEADGVLRKKIYGHVAKNEFLEEEVVAIEKVLEPMTDEYLLRVSDFNELRIEKTVDKMHDDHLDPGESEAESLETDPVLVAYREESNELFFILEKTEEKRHSLNLARKKELYGLLGSLPYDENDPRTINVQERIEDKIRGIYHVRGVAYQEQSAPDMGQDAEPVEQPLYAVDIDAPQGRENNPEIFVYYKMVDSMGYDPIELYKEDMRIKAEGGNPNLPRETKWDKRLNDSYLALTDDEKAALEARINAPEADVTPEIDEGEEVLADEEVIDSEATSDVTEGADEESTDEEVTEVDSNISEEIIDAADDEEMSFVDDEEEVVETSENDAVTDAAPDITDEAGDSKPSE